MTKTSLLFLLRSLTLFVLSSDLVMAVETTDSSSSIEPWPLILFLIVLIVFRKQLINEATPQLHEPDHHEHTDHSASEPAADDSKTTAKSGHIDLKDDSEQCQASTNKGTRCKRTTTLEDTTIKIGNKTYDLTVCKQHNNDALKPFADLIK